MSQFYGLLAGLFVCASTWGAITYISAQVGWLIGIFLLVFFTVTTVYINGDEMGERQNSVIKSLTDMELICFEKLKGIERKIASLEEKVANAPLWPGEVGTHGRELDTIIGMVEQILEDKPMKEKSATPAPPEPVIQPLETLSPD